MSHAMHALSAACYRLLPPRRFSCFALLRGGCKATFYEPPARAAARPGRGRSTGNDLARCTGARAGGQAGFRGAGTRAAGDSVLGMPACERDLDR